MNNASSTSPAPPTFLAIDASTERCSVALSTASETLSDHCDTPKSHAKVLLPMVDALLQRAKLELEALDAILVGVGPGSFTGIRIGISVAQGLAYGAKVPLYGSASLEILAQALSKITVKTVSSSPTLVIPCLDARMSEIYWAVYRVKEGELEEVLPARVSSAQALTAYLEAQALAKPQISVVGGGHGWGLSGLADHLSANIYPELLPDAAYLAEIWRAKFGSAQPPVSALGIEPMYLRNEVSWDKRKRVRSYSPFSS